MLLVPDGNPPSAISRSTYAPTSPSTSDAQITAAARNGLSAIALMRISKVVAYL
jgi:hypothetical protein